VADEQIVTSIVAKADLSSLVSEVHRASSSLQQLQRELLASNKAISSSTKLANNLFRDTLTGSGQFSSHFVNLNSDVDKFGKNLDAGRLKLKNYFSTFREHATTQKGMIRELAKEQVMLQNSVLQPLGRNAQGLMQYNVMIPRGLDAVKNSAQLARMEMQIMNRALSEGAGSLINWGKNTQWAGRQLTVGLTVPLTMFGAAAGKAFREADQELVRLTKVYGGLAATSAADLKAIREEVVQTAKSLSQTMGASFKDTIALGADIAATGKMGNDLLGSIEETTRLAILGEVDRQDAMKATLSIQTAFKQNTEQLTESINFLNAVENQTSTTLNDLVEAIPKAGPVVQQLGGSIEDLALYMTAMREGGINASEGANALKSGLASLINPTKQTVGMMSEFGIDVMGMVAKNTGDTTGLLMDLQFALNKLDPLSKARALEQMFGKFQFARMSALLNNLGKEGSQTLQVMELMKASTSDLAGIAERELGMITESASGKYRRAMESLKASLADIGEDFLPVATKLLNAASKILNFFSELPGPIKKAVTYLAGFTAVVGPLIMLTGVLANFFGYITKGIVQLRAFFMRASGWKMLTPEIIAAQKAAEMVENAFYSDAAAAQVLHNALQKLVLDYQNLQAASMKSAVPVNPGVSTVAGSPVMSAGRRIVDPNDPYVGDVNTRAMSHINPRDPNNPATIFGGVPGAVPVNRGISRTPQIYMHDRLPNYEGITSVKGISTGIVPGEAAKFHALMATLGMQTEQEVAALKKTIAMGGTVSRELLDTFDDILPITQRFADSAATQAALIVQQMRSAEITVEQAKARILALNAQIEADMGSAVSMYAAGRGRTIDLTRAPMMDQPVVDANGQFTLRDLYKKKANASVMNEFGRLRGVRTFGAPYSIQTTRMPRFNDGGGIESFGPGKTMVSGPSSINYDDRLGSVPVGGYVLNQSASMDPANAPLVAMASATYENGGQITAALTPREVVFGPKIQRMPELYAAVDAANSGYNFGGQIMDGVTGYGQKTGRTPNVEDKAYYKKQLKEYLRFINNPRYEDDIRVRMIMLDAAELAHTAGIPVDKAIKIASGNFDLAKNASGGSIEKFIEQRIKQVQGLEKRYPALKHPDSSSTRTPNSKALNYKLNDVRSAMLKSPRFKNVFDLIEGISPTTIKNPKGMPLLEGLHVRGHVLRHGEVGYATRGHMGVAAVLPHGINSLMSRLQGIGISPDVLSLTGPDARKNFEVALKSVGMHRMTTVDDIATALEDNNLFKSKSEIQSGRSVRATSKQRNDLQMFLEAVMSRKKWVMIPRGRPPIMTPVLARLNKGGMIPGGSISRGRTSYGNPMSLLAPDKMLKVLAKAKQLSSREALGSFADTPVTQYGHRIAGSSGMSYPVPGVSGVYRDAKGKLVFVKGVPSEAVAIHEPIGADIVRMGFGIHTPVMGARTVSNPLDPTKKTKLLALESDYDPRFANTNMPWEEGTVIRQLAASLLMNNKDLSRSNVFGNFNPDVGNAGVFKAASGNTAVAKANEMNSMEKQAMINLLAVRGGARKDFARDTAPIVAKMSPKKYGRLMKKALEEARPEIVKIISGLPKNIRGPYIELLKRLDDGIEVDWSKYHALHANPKYLNAGGPIGGAIRRGRYAYGRKDGSQRSGNPAKRAEQERIRAARAASYTPSGGSSYTATGNPQMQVARGSYVGGTGVSGNVYAGVPTASMARTVSTMRLAQFPYMNMPTMPMNIPGIGNTAAITQAFSSVSSSIQKGSIRLNLELLEASRKMGIAYKQAGISMMNTAKTAAASARTFTTSAVTSTTNWAKGAATRLQTSILREQAAVTARHYPTGGFDPYQRSYFGPGMVGDWKNTGQDGIQKRKVGSLGFRKTEFMVGDQVMTRSQAKAAGVSVPGRGPMGMGAQMGIGMAGSMGGMALMSKEKVNILGHEMSGMSAGMGVMAASSILPFLPYAKMGAGLKSAGTASVGLAKGMKAAYQAGTFLSKIIPKLLHFSKVLGPIGTVITIASTAFALFKANNDAWQDARMGLSMTSKAAEQAGVKYFNLQETMQGYLDKQKAVAVAGKASQYSSIGMPGLPQSIEDMKKAKEEGKGLKDLIESINRSTSTAETKRLVTNQKAQYVAAGMSIEDANRKIYGALLNSEKSGQVFDIIGNSLFGSITDKASAAEYSVKNLINTLNNGDGTADWGKEVGVGFEGLINVFSSATNSLIGTKDALGNVIDEYKAYQMVMGDAESNNPKINDAIGESVYSNLVDSQPLLELIANKSDSIKGILAKWKLFTSGVNIDLSRIDSTLAIKLAGFSQAIGTGISQLTKSADNATTFSSVGSALERLKKTIGAVSAASQRAANAAQRSAQEELKIIAKKIKLIDDEKNKKLESLRATQDASNYALALQKLQIEYADAVSRGDMATANRAQLEIDQLTMNRQTELATKAIEDAAARAKAPLEKKASGIQEASDKRSNNMAANQDQAASASEIAAKLTEFQERYNEIVERGIQAQLLPDAERKKEERAVRESLVAFAKEVQNAGAGSSALSKEIRNAFFKLGLFDKDGKPISVETKTPLVGLPTTFDKNGKPVVPSVTTINPGLTEQFAKDIKAVTTLALDITGGTTLDRLRIDLMAALGKSSSSKGNKNEIGGKVVPGKGGTPTKYYDASGNEITKEKYESLPAGPPQSRDGTQQAFSLPIEGMSNRNFASQPVVVREFYKANKGKGTFTSTDGYQYTAQGAVMKDGKRVGSWYNYIPNGQGRIKSYSQGSPGGVVSGPGTGTSDSIPAMLSNGEYVIRASSVKKYGTQTFDALNAQKFNKGGQAGKISVYPGFSLPVKPEDSVYYPSKDPLKDNRFYSAPSKQYPIDKIKSPMGTMQRFLDIARSQIGENHNYKLHDEFSPKGSFNDTFVNKFSIWANKKYGLDSDMLAWCGAFIAWVAENSGVKVSKKMFSGFQATKDYSKKGKLENLMGGKSKKKITPGDLLWFKLKEAAGPPDHAAIADGFPTQDKEISTIGQWGNGVTKQNFALEYLYGSVTPEFKKNPMSIGPRPEPVPLPERSATDSETAMLHGLSGFHKGGPVGHKHKFGNPSSATSQGSWWDKLGSKMSYKPDGMLNPAGMLAFGGLDMIKSLGAVALSGMAQGIFPARERDIASAAETTFVGPISRLLGSERFPNPWGESGMGMSSGWAKGMDVATILSAIIPFGFAARTSQQTAVNAAAFPAARAAASVGLAKPKATLPSLMPGVLKPKKVMPSEYSLAYDASGSMHRIDVKLGDETAGYLVWDKKTGVVENLHVYDKHKGKHIATTMYEKAMGIAPITHSAYRTPAGDAFAHSIGDAVVPLNDSWLPGDWTSAQLAAARARNESHVVTRVPRVKDPDLDGFSGPDIVGGQRVVGTENWGSLITENSDIMKILSELSAFYKVDVRPSVIRQKMPGNAAGYHRSDTQSVYFPDKTRGTVVAHEITHAADFQGAYWSFEDMLKYLLKTDRKSAEIVFNESMMNSYGTAKSGGNKPAWLYDSVFSNLERYAPQHLPYWRGLLEKNANSQIPNIKPAGLDLGNPYTDIYGFKLASMLKSSMGEGYTHYRSPKFWEALIADENIPYHLAKKGEGYIAALNRYRVDETTPNDSFQLKKLLEYAIATKMANGGLVGIPKFDAGINMVPADMLAMIHKNEAVIPANMNPFNPNATSSAIASGSVYNINVELNGTTVTAKDVAMEIHREMRIKEMASGVNRTVGRP
jgi:TP901 family phage tail tape measure protein